MTRARSHQVAIILTVVVFIVIACGGVSDTDQSAPTATVAPAMPQPGATFAGPLGIRTSDGNATASGGELELTISADGAEIASARYSLLNTRCSNAAGSITIESGGFSAITKPAQPITIANGSFEFSLGDLSISGQFTSPTEATATVEISTEESVGVGSPIICDFGSWDWSGTAQ